MAECPVLTSQRLDRLLAGALEQTERRLIREHFAAPCGACLETLENVDGDGLIAALGGSAAILSEEEADRIFRAAMPVRRLRRETIAKTSAIAASLLLAAVILPLALEERAEPVRHKSAALPAAIAVPLRAWTAETRDGEPVIIGPFESGATIERGQKLVFRYHVDWPANLYFVAETGGKRRILRRLEAASAGEHELAHDGQAIALDPAALGAALGLWILAVPAHTALEGEALTRAVEAFERERMLLVEVRE